jgi:dihydrolipoamide dehydrogenase
MTTLIEKNYDLIVIGAGPGGYVAAIRAAQLGMRVAVVESRKTLGGTCLNVGCIPSKALLDSSEQYHHAKTKLSKHGIMIGDVMLDIGQMQKRKDSVVRQNVSGVAMLFRKNRIDHVHGTGRFAGPGVVHVSGGEAGDATLKAPKILIATGSEPSSLPFLPFDGQKILSSTEALELSHVPKHLVVIGGGVIGLEMGSVWLRLGAKVTVVEYLDHLLGNTDRQCSDELRKILQKQGMEFRLSTKCLGAEMRGDWVIVQTEDMATGQKVGLECDAVPVATGRKPYTQGLGLESIGVALDKQGRIPVDEHFQTSAPGIYAIGDVIAGPMLAHKAEDEGVAVVELMAGQRGHVNYEAIPNIVYTWPELASVGYSEEELKVKGTAYTVGTFPFLANGRARAMDETEGFVKIISDAGTDRVLGVHIVGPRASDMIAEAVAVIEYGGSAEDIARTCHAHPTLAEVMREAALAVGKRAIHI